MDCFGVSNLPVGGDGIPRRWVGRFPTAGTLVYPFLSLYLSILCRSSALVTTEYSVIVMIGLHIGSCYLICSPDPLKKRIDSSFPDDNGACLKRILETSAV